MPAFIYNEVMTQIYDFAIFLANLYRLSMNFT